MTRQTSENLQPSFMDGSWAAEADVWSSQSVGMKSRLFGHYALWNSTLKIPLLEDELTTLSPNDVNFSKTPWITASWAELNYLTNATPSGSRS